MNRKQALSEIAIILGGTIVGAEMFLSGCTNNDKKRTNDFFTSSDISLLDEIGETIIPTTNTPGAKAVKIGQFMTVMVKDCYGEEDQKIFHEGMSMLDNISKKNYGNLFIKINDVQRHELLVKLDNEQKKYMDRKEFDDPVHYFRMMKELTLLGYFTSEIGCTKARRYVAVPGKYQGCIPYNKGDRAWTTP